MITDSLATRLVKDELGTAISAELVLMATILLIGLMLGMMSARDAVISEISDIAGGVQDMNQSFLHFGVSSASSSLPGSSFDDATDFGDDPGDSFGAADNCITFDVPPQDEQFFVEVSTEVQVLAFLFDDLGATDISPDGLNSGVLLNGASVVDGELVLDGDDDFVAIPNTSDINLTTVTERTIEIEFTPSDTTTRQIVFEAGGGVRGFNIYIENGELFVGAYNLANGEPQFTTFLSTPITAGETISTALTLDSVSGEFNGFLNGAQFGSGFGGDVFNHPGAIGLGALNGATVIDSGVLSSTATENYGFAGTISSFEIYNRVLSDDEILSLAQ